MRAHESDERLTASPHPAVSRAVERSRSVSVQAAVAGRTDTISSNAVLGLQRLAGNLSVASMLAEDEPSSVHLVVGSGGGAPLDSTTRTFMESRLGSDFGDVRVHTGVQADQSARSINAQAYTVGTDVVFQSGKYAPETDAGRRTIAHELAHVVQQKNGPVDGSPAPGGIRVSDPSDSFEQAAERTADQVMAADMAPVASSQTPGSIQREAAAGEEDDKEDEAQALSAQRTADEDEEEEV